MEHLVRPDDYLYAIRPDPYHYWTAATSAGLQALGILYYPAFLLLFFDPSGNLLEVYDRGLTDAAMVSAGPPGNLQDFSETAFHAMRWLLESRGYKEQTIRVKRFAVPPYDIAIKDFPDAFRDMLEHPGCYSDDELLVAAQELERWPSEGLFELWLNADSYRWIDRSGEVQAS